MSRLLLIGGLILLQWSCVAQDTAALHFTQQDTLRGTVTKERAWWDVMYYAITVDPDFANKTIKGTNVITFRVTGDVQKMQIDLQQPMQIDEVVYHQKRLKCSRDQNVYYLEFNQPLKKGSTDSIRITFSGKPREAVNPPWDGGWIWAKDKHGNPWMTVACQGLGASVWYPCKDYQGDEPDKGASLTIITPENLVGVGNGRMLHQTKKNNKNIYTWAVSNPINNYNIIPYIGKYVNWSETFDGEKGKLDVAYWALEEDEQKARKQFQQVPQMLKCFEHWFGPYPFYEDGYKIVEAPHLGMEHQSAIAYGNQFKNGYLGKDLSETGWGLKWDFIIVHESGHEWFGNNITTNDIADMWVHEGFTNYSEVLFTTCEYGVEAGNEYCIGLRKNIMNDQPLIGPYGVNHEGSVDMYYKGANLVHMIRQIIGDDEKFRALLRGMNKDFYHQTVTSQQIEDYINKKSGHDFSKLFEQYLHTVKIPMFQYQYGGGLLSYRWRNCVPGFNMPLKVFAGKTIWLYPDTNWKTMPLDTGDITIDPNFYIDSKKM
jgi:aminopeptidase N